VRFTGGGTPADAALATSIRRRVARAGGRAEFVHSFGQADRAKFLSSLTVLSVPIPDGEAFGTFILESLATGVPVVQPRAGGFTELVEDTGGGLLCEPGSVEALAGALGELLADRDRARAMGRRGREAVRSRYGVDTMAIGIEHALDRARTLRRNSR
jgi:glycosyltransferase involved in cell wall biosynthesis